MKIDDTSKDMYGWGTGTAVKRKSAVVSTKEAWRTKDEVLKNLSFARDCLHHNNYVELRPCIFNIKAEATLGESHIQDINTWITVANCASQALDLLNAFLLARQGLLYHYRRRRMHRKVLALLDLIAREMKALP